MGSALAAPAHGEDRAGGMPGIVVGGDITLSGARNTVAVMAGSVVVADMTAARLAVSGGNIQVASGAIDWFAAAGGTVALDGGALGDVAIVGGNVKVNTAIKGDLDAAAGTIVLTQDADVGGDVSLGGGDVTVDGTIGGDLVAHAEHLSVAGVVNGAARLSGADIRIAPGTHVKGDLTYATPAELNLADVTVDGKVTHEPVARWQPRSQETAAKIRHVFHSAGMLAAGGLILCGVVFWLWAPPVVAAAEQTLTQAFQASALTGVIGFCALPAALIVLVVTVVGIPLAFLTLAAGGTVIGLGILAVCMWAGGFVRAKSGRPDPATKLGRAGWLIAGVIAFLLLGSVPVLGGILQVFAAAVGSGAVVVSLWRKRRANVL
jgi:hypothetical protein